MKNTEIEIKVQVDKAELLVKFLQTNGTFKKSSTQIDEYHTPAHRNFVEADPIKEWLRLRDDAGRYSLNYKNWHYGNDDRAYHCDEYEIVIDSKEKAAHILESLDFKPLVTVHKKRGTYTYKDYEIAFDSVKELGEFIEVEFTGSTDREPALIAADMREFIESTGTKILSQDFAGYPIALIPKQLT